jgi:signal transduction histidine kinase
MAKETAHQLGTPLSSLIAWLEFLKMKGADPSYTNEIEKDIIRLQTITERFSKIGSAPALQKENVHQVLQHSVDYIKTRTSDKVSFTISDTGNNVVFAPMNIPLFEWVIENILKNSIDAMNGSGIIKMTITDQHQFVYIDISDTGKGVSKGSYKTIFKPGYTTKKRGWGLGLSLSKRIIEDYHDGQIFVKNSEPNKGSTFRIVLKK